ncbi:MAG: hypothetical protein V1856_03680 [Candidatus Liptonbacteria bacterium]
MILSKKSIEQAMENGDLTIEPFNRDSLKDASYTFTLAPKLKVRKQPGLEYEEISIGQSGFDLPPGGFIVGFTNEKIALNGKYGCFLSNRSSCAQMGLSVLLGSDFAEPDTDGTQTLEIHNISDNTIRLMAGMKIVKGIFMPIG